MARTLKRRREATNDYRLSGDGICEVSRWFLSDRDATRWMSNYQLSGTEVHHIFGRGKRSEYEFFSNLICISRAAHAWLHDVNPPSGELACLRAKLVMEHDLELRMLGAGMSLSRTPDTRHWHPESMGKICGCVDLAGRVSLLRDKVIGTVYERYADEILKELGV